MRPGYVCCCGVRFDTFRTGLTFASVRALMWSDQPPYPNKSRRAVLGFWHQLKLEMFRTDHSMCEVSEARAA